MFDEIQIEISGKCNARCKYCYTGICNREDKKNGSFMDVDVFKESIEYMLAEGIIGPRTNICLYNYGEPFLHPHFEEILQYLYDKELSFELSTNGSVSLRLSDKNKNLFKFMKNIKFSMCGFSQNSYDRISKLNFERVRNNIVSILDMVRSRGFKGNAVVKFHMYQFNINELEPCIKFALENRMILSPMHAIFADLQKQIEYVEKKLSIDEMVEVSRDMFWYYWEDIQKGLPKLDRVEECPFMNTLIIDENLNVLTCCLVTKNCGEGYSRGKLKEIDKKSLLKPFVVPVICKKCDDLNVWKVLSCSSSFYSPRIMGIPDLHDKKNVVLIGSDSITKAFEKLMVNINMKQYANAYEYQYSEDDYVVFASKKYYDDMDIVNAEGKLKEYFVFNLQLRV